MTHGGDGRWAVGQAQQELRHVPVAGGPASAKLRRAEALLGREQVRPCALLLRVTDSGADSSSSTQIAAAARG